MQESEVGPFVTKARTLITELGKLNQLEIFIYLILPTINQTANPPLSQTRLKPSPRLKCKSELFQMKETCTD